MLMQFMFCWMGSLKNCCCFIYLGWYPEFPTGFRGYSLYRFYFSLLVEFLGCFLLSLSRMNFTYWSIIFIFSSWDDPTFDKEFVFKFMGTLGCFSISYSASRSPNSFYKVLSGTVAYYRSSSLLLRSWGGCSCFFSFLKIMLFRTLI